MRPLPEPDFWNVTVRVPLIANLDCIRPRMWLGRLLRNVFIVLTALGQLAVNVEGEAAQRVASRATSVSIGVENVSTEARETLGANSKFRISSMELIKSFWPWGLSRIPLISLVRFGSRLFPLNSLLSGAMVPLWP